MNPLSPTASSTPTMSAKSHTALPPSEDGFLSPLRPPDHTTITGGDEGSSSSKFMSASDSSAAGPSNVCVGDTPAAACGTIATLLPLVQATRAPSHSAPPPHPSTTTIGADAANNASRDALPSEHSSPDGFGARSGRSRDTNNSTAPDEHFNTIIDAPRPDPAQAAAIASTGGPYAGRKAAPVNTLPAPIHTDFTAQNAVLDAAISSCSTGTTGTTTGTTGTTGTGTGTSTSGSDVFLMSVQRRRGGGTSVPDRADNSTTTTSSSAHGTPRGRGRSHSSGMCSATTLIASGSDRHADDAPRPLPEGGGQQEAAAAEVQGAGPTEAAVVDEAPEGMASGTDAFGSAAVAAPLTTMAGIVNPPPTAAAGPASSLSHTTGTTTGATTTTTGATSNNTLYSSASSDPSRASGHKAVAWRLQPADTTGPRHADPTALVTSCSSGSSGGTGPHGSQLVSSRSHVTSPRTDENSSLQSQHSNLSALWHPVGVGTARPTDPSHPPQSPLPAAETTQGTSSGTAGSGTASSGKPQTHRRPPAVTIASALGTTSPVTLAPPVLSRSVPGPGNGSNLSQGTSSGEGASGGTTLNAQSTSSLLTNPASVSLRRQQRSAAGSTGSGLPTFFGAASHSDFAGLDSLPMPLPPMVFATGGLSLHSALASAHAPGISASVLSVGDDGPLSQVLDRDPDSSHHTVALATFTGDRSNSGLPAFGCGATPNNTSNANDASASLSNFYTRRAAAASGASVTSPPSASTLPDTHGAPLTPLTAADAAAELRAELRQVESLRSARLTGPLSLQGPPPLSPQRPSTSASTSGLLWHGLEHHGLGSRSASQASIGLMSVLDDDAHGGGGGGGGPAAQHRTLGLPPFAALRPLSVPTTNSTAPTTVTTADSPSLAESAAVLGPGSLDESNGGA